MKIWYVVPAFLCLLSLNLFCVDLSIRVIDRDLEIPLEGVRILDVQTARFVFTDGDGKATLVVDDGLSRLIIMAELIGYEDRKLIIKDFSKELVIEMLLEGVIEGEELVFEEEAIGETDEEIGISTVIEEELIESASKIGIIEDAMSAVKILPGVIYTGAFGGSLSVRGGDPSGLNVLLDGFAVKYPYHWGGVVSIFNPNIIESIKFSPGIFSSKYGQATSGILELTTVTPNEGTRIEAITSTSTMELFLQMPLGNNDEAGLFTGFRLTNYDLVVKIVRETGKAAHNDTLLEMTNVISRVPYIYDFYLKTFYRPSERFEWYVNGFWGNDGIGVT
ncbi:MAG: TonB-dependent receptor plug domain-containing protein, partial [Spirochaetales bacterium]|nr:TonB-dependent receptor plug domain-containing protein [Spirochaetales bacterium]